MEGIQPEDGPEALKALGNAAFKQRSFEKALLFYRDALNAEPESPKHAVLLSNMYGIFFNHSSRSCAIPSWPIKF